MLDFLLVEDLDRERRMEVQRFWEAPRLIAKTDKSRRPEFRGRHVAWLVSVLRCLLGELTRGIRPRMSPGS